MNAKSKKAFTLLEVMLTVSILAVCMVFVIKGFFSSLKAIKTAEEYADAIGAADSAMFRMELLAVPKEEIAANGEPPGFEYSLSMTPLDQPGGEGDLQQADLLVQWMIGEKKKAISLSTLFIDETAKEKIGDLSQR